MLGWAFTFLVLALVAGFLGLGGIAVLSASIARVIFTVFLILFIVTAVAHVVNDRRSRV